MHKCEFIYVGLEMLLTVSRLVEM